MFDRQLAHQLTLRNLLQRAGYRDLDAVREEGRQRALEEGRQRALEEGLEPLRKALRTILLARGCELGPPDVERIASCRDPELLAQWFERASTARVTADAFK